MCCVVACQRSVHSRQEHRSVEQDQREGSECEHEVYKSTALVLSSHDFCTTHIHQSHVRATLRHSSLQQGTQAVVLTYLIPTENDIKSYRGHLFYSMGQLHTKALQLHRLLGQSSEGHPILSECTQAYNMKFLPIPQHNTSKQKINTLNDLTMIKISNIQQTFFEVCGKDFFKSKLITQ